LLVLYIGLFIAVTDNHYWTVLPQLSGSAAHTHRRLLETPPSPWLK